MIDDLFSFFKSNLTFYGLVIRRNGCIKNSIFYFSLTLTIALGILFLFYQKDILIYSMVVLSVLSVFIGKLINASTIKSKYPKFWESRFNWNSSEFREMYIMYLERYLIRIHNKSSFKEIEDLKLDKIQSMISDRANRERIPSLIFISTFIALFLPLWSAYIIEILSISKGNIIGLGYLFILFLLIIVSFAITTPMLIELRDGMITKYQKWNRLNDLIDELRLRH